MCTHIHIEEVYLFFNIISLFENVGFITTLVYLVNMLSYRLHLVKYFNQGHWNLNCHNGLFDFVSSPLICRSFFALNIFAGWNMIVCVVMGVAQLLIWAVFAHVARHPSRWKVWVVVLGGALAMLLEIYDFPPYMDFVDAHALWHASTIPLTYLWWSFIRDDAEFRTSYLLKKAK